jgi:glycosyltransferase involved in cell wall biosynthesis
VSVVITSYNYARFIGQAIQSVLDQTYRDLQIIVVDDGSTDETRAVLDRFGSAITCIYQQNQGKSAALNQGLALAQGQYVAFLDSDDYWLPDAVAARVAAFEAEPTIGVVYGRARVIDEKGQFQPYTLGAPEPYPGQTFKSLLCGVFVYFLTLMVRRDCLQAVGGRFDPDFGTTNDWELYLRLSRVCRFHYLNRPLACYRVHSSNWSSNPALMAEQMTRLIDRTLAATDLPNEVQKAKDMIYRNLYTSIALEYLKAGRGREALGYLFKAARVSRRPVRAAAWAGYLALAQQLSQTPWGARAVSGAAVVKQSLNHAVGRR